MAGNMFQDVVSPHADSPRKWYALPLSFAVHTVVLAVVIVAPLVATDVIPSPRKIINFVVPDAPPMPVVVARRVVQSAPSEVASNNAAPVEPPDEIGRETGLQITSEPPSRNIEGIVDGLGGNQVIVDAPPPAPPTRPMEPLRPGGNIKPPSKIRDTAPEYPELARRNRVQGMVIVEATIGTDGKVERARVLRSVPLLDHAALNAVQSWVYTPTLLNGVPVPIIMTVTVRFTLE